MQMGFQMSSFEDEKREKVDSNVCFIPRLASSFRINSRKCIEFKTVSRDFEKFETLLLSLHLFNES